MHYVAENIRYQEKKRALQMAEKAQGEAADAYNRKAAELRKLELETEALNERLANAEETAEQMRSGATAQANKAAAAARDAAVAGSEVAGKEAMQAEAKEMQAAAKSAQRSATAA